MAKVMVSMRIMPESVEINLKDLEKKVKEEISKFGGDVVNVSVSPIAFGLNALDIEFFMDEKLGGTDPLEEKIAGIEGVVNASTTSVRRVVG
ncbi:elongation factor 1-beta [Candidatus Woesearchaeota archaeon]|nr:elongation factor 1-beta [Candidatus Woesearchaeota archaeon]